MNFEEEDYKRRYVAFLDLLGFRSMVYDANTDAEKRAKLRYILEITRDCLCESPRIDSHLTFFSDCLIFSTQAIQPGLEELFQSVKLLSENLLQLDVLLRGGITVGLAHHGETFVYGAAVNDAYNLEHDVAKNPCTIISEEVFAEAIAYNEGFRPWMRADGPGRYFLHSLIGYEHYRPKPLIAGMQILDEPARRIVYQTWQRLNAQTDERVKAKAQWFASYWNSIVSPENGFQRIDPKVTPPAPENRNPAIAYRRVVG